MSEDKIETKTVVGAPGVRSEFQLYPDFTAEIEAIAENGISDELLNKIIAKHLPNANYNKSLYKRYETLNGCVPIFNRTPRFAEDEEEAATSINNRINNDFFGEIIDFKTGYFAGKPVSYGYGDTRESKEETGGEEARDLAVKALTDFTTENNMFDKDMEVTKYASICGYAGRLFYHDEDGHERVMATAPYETIILSKTSITEPLYGVRYYSTTDLNGTEIWKAEFYDDSTIRYYEGTVGSMHEIPGTQKPNLYGMCPLQGIPNNTEMLGDAEKVLTLIDAYDRALSDANNDNESFANAYMIFENVNISDEEIERGQKSGAFQYYNGGSSATGAIRFLTKDINDSFIEHHLGRIEQNIYRFSKTPDLSDESFGNAASGVSLKFKLTGLETKCGIFQAKMMSAGVYMFKLLASSFQKKRIAFDPLQATMDFSRNFPADLANEAQVAQQLINAGLPKRIAYGQLSFVDDVEYVMQLIEDEKDDIPDLDYNLPDDEEDDEEDGEDENITEGKEESGKEKPRQKKDESKEEE